MLGYPSKKDFESMVHAILIANYPATPENATDAHELLGENVAGLRARQFVKSQSKC